MSATFLAAAAMYQDLSKLRAVELWLRDADFAAEVGRRLQAAGLPRTWAMLQEHVLLPYARRRRAERLAVLTPIHSVEVRSSHTTFHALPCPSICASSRPVRPLLR